MMNQKHKIPYVFILDYLHPKEVKIKPMFGCFGLYVDDKIIFFLRDRKEKPELNGVWVAVGILSYYESLAKKLPSVNQDKKLVEDKKSNNKWLLISIHDDNFETIVIKACELVLNGNEGIGKVTKGSLI